MSGLRVEGAGEGVEGIEGYEEFKGERSQERMLGWNESIHA